MENKYIAPEEIKAFKDLKDSFDNDSITLALIEIQIAKLEIQKAQYVQNLGNIFDKASDLKDQLKLKYNAQEILTVDGLIIP